MMPISVTIPPITPPAIALVFVLEAEWLAELFVGDDFGINLVTDSGAAW
jgi:hypothetical protein